MHHRASINAQICGVGSALPTVPRACFPDGTLTVVAQEAMALSDEQADQACDKYESMLASLKRLTSEQDAVLAGWPQQPGAVYITSRVRLAQHLLELRQRAA